MKPKTEYIDVNGVILEHPVCVSTFSRGLMYGDGIFETMHYYNGSILFSEDHFERLEKGLHVLSMQMPAGLTIKKMFASVRKLADLNGRADHARIRLQLTRNDGGHYAPLTRKTSYILTVTSLKEEIYALNKNGLHVDVCTSVHLPVNELSNLKTCNVLPYIMAAIYAKENMLDDCLLLNAKNKIAEATSSNVFSINGGVIFTPSLSDGCVDGVMRRNIISIARYLNFKVKEQSMSVNDLVVAEEIFLTNVIRGIQFVGIFNGIKKKINSARLIHGGLVELVKSIR